MWVVKLGGSLQNSEYLQRWLDTLTGRFAGKAMIVAGGGKYADAVREQQRVEGLDDCDAHRLALMATEDFAKEMQGLCPALQLVDEMDELSHCLLAGKVPVWLPARELAGKDGIPSSWEFTSDSVAAWLALQIQAESLFLVKSVGLENHSPDLRSLSELGFVDSGMQKLSGISTLPIYWVERSQTQQFFDFHLSSTAQQLPRVSLN